jgi:hypothetical protein
MSVAISQRALMAAATKPFVAAIKVGRGCADCGYREHSGSLEFDHTADDKLANISTLVNQGFSTWVILREIAKCDAVCANCHRRRTRERALGRMTLGSYPALAERTAVKPHTPLRTEIDNFANPAFAVSPYGADETRESRSCACESRNPEVVDLRPSRGVVIPPSATREARACDELSQTLLAMAMEGVTDFCNRDVLARVAHWDPPSMSRRLTALSDPSQRDSVAGLLVARTARGKFCMTLDQS